MQRAAWLGGGGKLTLERVTLGNDSIPGEPGGAIFSLTDLTLINSTVSGARS